MLVDYGDDSCKFLREINLNSAIRREELNNVTKSASSVVDLSIKRWIGENNKKFSNKKINLYHKGRSLTSKDYGVDGVINVFFWMVEIENKNMIDVIFFSKSKYSHIVTSRQCELGGSLNDCLNKTVYELLEKNVSSQVFNNDANPI
ncbi:MAG TPA: hypothetical protein DIW64_14960 [Cellvibrio sp.]|nr:hypothetical protein [Cellvibrio sp.]